MPRVARPAATWEIAVPSDRTLRPVADEATRLAPVVAQLLRDVPDKWAAFDPAEMTAEQDRALYLLTAAEMVERRLRFRVSMVTAPTLLEAVLTVTGVEGFHEGMNPLLAKAWSLWEERFKAWNAGDARETTPFIVESVPPHEWRLTQSGILARNDIDAGDTGGLDFVLWQGFFDGQPRPTQDGRISQRCPTAGFGRLESLTERANGPELPRVNVANWSEGVEVLSGRVLADVGTMLANHFKASGAAAVNASPDARHSADFSHVYWFGQEYKFAIGLQAGAVRALWAEWEKTGLGLHQETIRVEIDAERDNFRMAHVFRNHPALGRMIDKDGEGRYRLKSPR